MKEGDKEIAPIVTETTTTAPSVMIETTPGNGNEPATITTATSTPELRESTVKEQ